MERPIQPSPLRLLLAALSLIVGGGALHGQEPQLREITVQVAPNVRRAERADGPKASLTVTYEACDETALALEKPTNQKDILSRLTVLLKGAREEDTAAQLAIWHPDDRAAQMVRLNDPQKRRESRQAVTSVKNFYPLAIVHFGHYRLVVVARVYLDLSVITFVFPFLEEGGQYWFTDDFRADTFYFFASNLIAKEMADQFLQKHPEVLK